MKPLLPPRRTSEVLRPIKPEILRECALCSKAAEVGLTMEEAEELRELRDTALLDDFLALREFVESPNLELFAQEEMARGDADSREMREEGA